MEEFTTQPDYSAQKKMAPRVRRAKFGDGYEQRTLDGLNAKLQEWSLSFKSGTTEAETIYTFLTDRGGVEAFKWTTPDGKVAAWVCDEHTLTRDNYGWSTVTAVFREVPEAVV